MESSGDSVQVQGPIPNGEPEEFFTVCEVHYGDAGRPYGYAEPEHNPMHSESVDVLRVTLERMLHALTNPVLSDDDMTGDIEG